MHYRQHQHPLDRVRPCWAPAAVDPRDPAQWVPLSWWRRVLWRWSR